VNTLRSRAANGARAAGRAQTDGACAVEARSSRTYQDGVDILLRAANDAMATSTLAAAAEAKVELRTLLAVSGQVLRIEGLQ